MNSSEKFRITPRNCHEALYLITSMALIFVDWIPEVSNVSSISFICLFSFSFCFWLMDKFKQKKIFPAELLVVVFLFYLVCNFFVALINGIAWFSWVRAAMPVLVFAYSLFVFEMLKRSSVQYLASVLIVSAFLWSVLLIYSSNINIVQLISNRSRITGIEQGFVIPYPFLGAVLILGLYQLRVITTLLLFYFVFLILVTGYKAQLALLVLAVIFYSYKEKVSLIPLGAAAGVGLFIFFGISISGVNISIFEYLAERFSSVGGAGDEIRIFEIFSALGIFSDAPFLGSGLGVEFPLKPDSVDTKNYIHNFFFYYLATIGMIGLLLMLVMLYIVAKRPGRLKPHLSGFFFSYVLLLLAALTAASFKLIHYNFFLAVLFVAIYFSSSRVGGKIHA